MYRYTSSATNITVTLPEPFASIPRKPLLFGPSPIQFLPRISESLSPEYTVHIYAKREDSNSGLAFGGNKVRKLEYLAADARSNGATHLVSVGGVQSNHTRAVAAVAACLGMKARLVQEQWVPWEDPAYDKVGNIQLSRMMGATTQIIDEGFDIGHKDTVRRVCCAQVEADGGVPYYIPAGASDHPLGGCGFARWAWEVVAQEAELGVFFGTIIVCAVTGGTLAGMVAGFKYIERIQGGRPRRVIGIDASAKPSETRAQTLRIARSTAILLGQTQDFIKDTDVELDERFHGGTYGVPDETTIAAMRFGAETEAFITDPVYEGKSLAGMVQMVRNGEIGGNVLYAHLGGQLALNAYSSLEF